jgi:hypothetical protein
VLNVIYHHRSENENQPLPVSSPNIIALTVLSIGIILVGIFFAPLFNWGTLAAAAF